MQLKRRIYSALLSKCMNHRRIKLCGVIILVAFIYAIIYYNKSNVTDSHFNLQLSDKFTRFENALKKETQLYLQLVDKFNSQSFSVEQPPPDQHSVTLPVLVIACDRVTVRRTLDTLIARKTEFSRKEKTDLPLYVSHGCRHAETAEVLEGYGQLITVLKYYLDPNALEERDTRTAFEGYRRVAHHYKWALDQMLTHRNFDALIVVEDDLDLAPDFFEYFVATLPLLRNDKSLYCVSAWTDNGKSHLVDLSHPAQLYRTDFFSGLGWMLLRSLWMEIRTDWPDNFWDEYMRKPVARKGRSCIRPEISRTITFGRYGVSQGQYFDAHLRFIHLNTIPVDFLRLNLTYLEKTSYDKRWFHEVHVRSLLVTLDDVLNDRLPSFDNTPSLRLDYSTQAEFEKLARALGAMWDFKAGIPRNAYHAAVPLMWNKRRLYLASKRLWFKYDPTWV